MNPYVSRPIDRTNQPTNQPINQPQRVAHVSIVWWQDEQQTLERAHRAEALKAEGNALFGQRDYHGAIARYTDSLDIEPSAHMVLTNRAAAYYRVGDYKASLLDAEHAIGLQPTWAKAYYRQGMALLALRRSNLAVDAFTRCLELDATEDTEVQRTIAVFHAAHVQPRM